ncbi:hypothetical protein [Streptomyces sp. NPDC059072]|uniref:hypothetical protein n=1 Tax=Streptomyces sp. NPDC059072 TaxID=3346715 RepID=UPI003681A463
MNLKEWAKAQGVHPQTAYRRFREGASWAPAERSRPRTFLAVTTAVAEHGERLGSGGCR